MNDIQTLRAGLMAHRLYRSLTSADHVRLFMEHHVFAVWDFMTLLKRLQRDLTCVEGPWLPRADAGHARFVNELVLDEESDEDGEQGYLSHFELYLMAMRETGASTQRIDFFLDTLRRGVSVSDALRVVEAPASVCRFVSHTMMLAEKAQTHEVCSAFFYGREEIIPDMFDALLSALPLHRTGRLRYYLQRHVDVDDNKHGPAARRLLDYVCQNNPERIADAQRAAQSALRHRIELWNGVIKAQESTEPRAPKPYPTGVVHGQNQRANRFPTQPRVPPGSHRS